MRWGKTMWKWIASAVFVLLVPGLAQAGSLKIVSAEFVMNGSTWTVSATLRYPDTGWSDFADEWRVVDGAGKVLGDRVLFHPHEDEQPFTRTQDGIAIPATTHIVYIEAHDKVHGWTPDRLRVDLRKTKGPRYRVVR